MIDMLDINIGYDHLTRRLSVNGHRCLDEIVGGTSGDANSTRLIFAFSGISGQYTVKCVVASPQRSGNEVHFPEYTLTGSTLLLSGEIMASAAHDEIPIQLHFITSTEEWYSENCVKLKILPAIRGKDLEIIPPVPRPTSDIVTDVTYDGDATLTIYYAEAQQKQIHLNILGSHDSLFADSEADVLRGYLAETDYLAIKFAEGELSEEEYAPMREQRRQWRARINELEN